MQDKMEKLLNQIGMSKDYLENSSINKIIVYDKNNLWEFIIDNDKVLPIYVYEELCNKIMLPGAKVSFILSHISSPFSPL